MDNKKRIKTRIQHKHAIESNWEKAINFIPLEGELIVYDVDETHHSPRFKIGDGKTKVNELPFTTLSGADKEKLDNTYTKEEVDVRINNLIPRATIENNTLTINSLINDVTVNNNVLVIS